MNIKLFWILFPMFTWGFKNIPTPPSYFRLSPIELKQIQGFPSTLVS